MRISNFNIPYLHQRFDYNPVSGLLRWNELTESGPAASRFNKLFAGKVAGSKHTSKTNTYIIIYLDWIPLLAHHIAWKMTYSEDPAAWVDHINRNKSDNRISNLRLADFVQSSQNRSKKLNNTSGITGVSQRGSKWRARIMVNGKEVSLGDYSSFEDAVEVRKVAELEYFGEFTPMFLETER
jgi:hypothetical protein